MIFYMDLVESNNISIGFIVIPKLFVLLLSFIGLRDCETAGRAVSMPPNVLGLEVTKSRGPEVKKHIYNSYIPIK